jgi:hypothetical protein
MTEWYPGAFSLTEVAAPRWRMRPAFLPRHGNAQLRSCEETLRHIARLPVCRNHFNPQHREYQSAPILGSPAIA